MVSFSFTQKGQVENQIVHLKTQKLYDKIGKIIEPKQIDNNKTEQNGN